MGGRNPALPDALPTRPNPQQHVPHQRPQQTRRAKPAAVHAHLPSLISRHAAYALPASKHSSAKSSVGSRSIGVCLL